MLWIAASAVWQKAINGRAPQTLASQERTVIDVRRAMEWDEGHVPGARHIYLGDLVDQTKDLPRDLPIALHCQGATRASIAASLLQKAGFTNVANLTGGYRAWTEAGLPVERDSSASR